MKPVLVIANPNAADGRGARVIPAVREALRTRGIRHTLRLTESPGHAREMARSLEPDEVRRILVVGGDGTIHEVAGGLIARADALRAENERHGTPPSLGSPASPEIAVLPVGTGNDFHRMVRAPAGVEDAVRALEAGVPRAFEVGEVRWDGGCGHFVNLIGVGIDVEVLRRRERFRRLPGLLQYMGALASALRRYRGIELSVVLQARDGSRTTIEAPILLSAVTVGPSVGGGFFLSPQATPDDGLLDLFVVRTLGILKVVRYLPGILRGRAVARPEIWQLQGIGVEIRSRDGSRFDFELDGELMEASTQFLEIRVRPESLRILELPREGG